MGRGFFVSLLLAVLTVLAAALFFHVYRVRDRSMSPAFDDGELVFALSYPGQRYACGDIVVFHPPEREFLAIKRVVLTGEQEIVIEQSALVTPGSVLPLNGDQALFLDGFDTVPSNHLFVAGDNHDRSIDSRDFGFVPVDAVVARVVF